MTTKRYTDEQLKEAVTSSSSVMEVMRKLGIKMAGGSHYHISNRIKKEGLDASHFGGRGWNKGRTFPSQRKKLSEIFIILPADSNRPKGYLLRRALLESGVSLECFSCKLTEWMDNPIPLEVDHIDGNWLDNRKVNLRFLCPNCHALTQTYGKQRADVVKQENTARLDRVTERFAGSTPVIGTSSIRKGDYEKSA